jgi:predicted alpha/beta superfamily hydrolase
MHLHDWLILLLGLTWTGQLSAQITKPHTASPQVQLLDSAFQIPQLDKTRGIWLYLPPDYTTSKRRYPVLYLMDGQNMFDAALAYAGEWGIDESLDSLHAAGVPACIVVAIAHGGRDRTLEYRPYPSQVAPNDACCAADSMAAFVALTLKPYIDRQFRTRPGRAHTGIGGASTGAYFAQHVVHRYPQVFGRAMLFSPSYMHADPRFYEDAGSATLPRGSRFYLVTGTEETALGLPPGRYREATTRMVATLTQNGRRIDKTVTGQLRPDGAHAEWFWRREFPAAYCWLFR